ncbi:MAG TPA: SLBB domain-containing protein [Steroidobacteraceae bacterium]
MRLRRLPFVMLAMLALTACARQAPRYAAAAGGQYPYVPNMTVENAIAIAGGFTPRAFKTKITITRKVQGVPTRITLLLRYPLRPGDPVEVSERWF